MCGGWYEQQLANRTGLSRRTIQDWEDQGKTTVKTYTAFLHRLGVTDLRQFDKHYEDFHRPFSEIVRKGLPLVLPSIEWNPDWMPPGALLRVDPTSTNLGDAAEHYALSQFAFAGMPGTRMPDNWKGYDLAVCEAG